MLPRLNMYDFFEVAECVGQLILIGAVWKIFSISDSAFGEVRYVRVGHGVLRCRKECDTLKHRKKDQTPEKSVPDGRIIVDFFPNKTGCAGQEQYGWRQKAVCILDRFKRTCKDRMQGGNFVIGQIAGGETQCEEGEDKKERTLHAYMGRR